VLAALRGGIEAAVTQGGKGIGGRESGDMLAAMALRTSVLSFIPHGQAQKLGDQVEEEEGCAAVGQQGRIG